MALPELVANSPVPGTPAPLGTITVDITTTGGTTITTSAVAPAPLQAAGQFRICIDNEIMIVTAGAATTTWTVTRQAENSSPATHTAGASIYHFLTADALKNMATQFGFPTATVTVAASNAPPLVQTAAQFVCDGIADQVEINNAILSLPSGGGLVLLSEGTYTITAPIVFQEDNSGLLGMTRGTVIISMGASFSGAAMITCNRDDLAGTNLRPCSDIDVGNFSLVGNKIGTQGTTDGIVFKAFRSRLHDVDVWYVNGCGIRVRGCTAAERGTASDWSTFGTIVTDCKVHENGNGGVNYDVSSTDASITRCEIFQNAGPGFQTGAVVNELTHCFIWGNLDQVSSPTATQRGAGILLQAGGGRMIMVSNKIEQNRGGIVIVAGSDYQIVANSLSSNSTAINPASTSTGNITGWAVQGLINVTSDLMLAGSGGAPTGIYMYNCELLPSTYAGDHSKYAIDIASGNFVTIRHCGIGAGDTGTINGEGVPSVISVNNNIGWVTEASGTATITSAATSVVVTHGLSITPLAQDIAVTLTNLPTTSIAEVYVDTITSTQFTIRCRNVPGAATAIFGWSHARHKFS